MGGDDGRPQYRPKVGKCQCLFAAEMGVKVPTRPCPLFSRVHYMLFPQLRNKLRSRFMTLMPLYVLCKIWLTGDGQSLFSLAGVRPHLVCVHFWTDAPLLPTPRILLLRS